MRNAKFVRNLKEQLEGEIFLASLGEAAFNIADSIACVLNEYQGNGFDSNRQIIMRSDKKLPQPFASWSNSL